MERIALQTKFILGGWQSPLKLTELVYVCLFKMSPVLLAVWNREVWCLLCCSFPPCKEQLAVNIFLFRKMLKQSRLTTLMLEPRWVMLHGQASHALWPTGWCRIFPITTDLRNTKNARSNPLLIHGHRSPWHYIAVRLLNMGYQTLEMQMNLARWVNALERQRLRSIFRKQVN